MVKCLFLPTSQSPVWTLVPVLLLCRYKHYQLLCFHPQYEHFSRLVQESPHTQRTRKSKVHGNIQFTVGTLIQSKTNRFSIPNIALLYSVLGRTTLSKVFSINSQRTACLKAHRRSLMIFNRWVRDKFCPSLSYSSEKQKASFEVFEYTYPPRG